MWTGICTVLVRSPCDSDQVVIRRDLVELVRQRMDVVTERIADEVLAQIPGELGGGSPAAIRVDAGRLLSGYLDALADGRPMSEPEMEAVRGVARWRAVRGQGLIGLLHGLRIGVLAIWAEMDAIVADRGDPHRSVAFELSGSMLESLHAMSSAATIAYDEAEARPEASDVHRARRVMEVLRAGAPGIDPSTRWQLIALVDEQPRPDTLRRALTWCAARPELFVPIPAAMVGDVPIVALSATGAGADITDVAGRLVDELGVEASAWSPTVAPGEIDPAIDELMRIAEFLRGNRTAEHTHLVTLDDVLLVAIARGWGGRTRERLRDIGAPLVAHDEEHRAPLRETVRALARNGSISQAAVQLNVHRNTVSWRLDLVRDLTGLDATVANELLVLAAAVEAV